MRSCLLHALVTAREVCLLQTQKFLDVRLEDLEALEQKQQPGDAATDFLELADYPSAPTMRGYFATLPAASAQQGYSGEVNEHRWSGTATGGRIGPMLSPHFTEFRLIHIPKTAGTSLGKDVKNDAFVESLNLRVLNWEWCFPPHRKDDAFHLMMLRSPRAHVMSQFLECKYDWWGKAVTQNTAFPHSLDDDLGFAVWLDHFWPPRAYDCDCADMADCDCLREDDFNCYNPHNMQSRSLTCSGTGPYNSHHVAQDTGIVPSAQEAVANLGKIEWVGIVELYDESLCLFFYKVEGRLRDHCACERSNPERHHNDHGVPPHDVESQAKAVLQLVDRITAVDQVVYRAAVHRVVNELRVLEKKAGVQILCPGRMEDLRRTAHYLDGMDDVFVQPL
jgi:hypothetical protein